MARPVSRETANAMPAANRTSFKKGVATNPTGKQGRVRHTTLSIEQRRELAQGAGITPLQFLMSVMVDEKEEMDSRIKAAVSAAPYFHRKQPIGIDNGKGGPVGFWTPDQLARLSDEDLERVYEILAKIAVAAEAAESGEAAPAGA